MAKWIIADKVYGFLKCSNCGWEFQTPDEEFDEQYPSWSPLDFKFCPMCGEKIETSENEKQENSVMTESICDICGNTGCIFDSHTKRLNCEFFYRSLRSMLIPKC